MCSDGWCRCVRHTDEYALKVREKRNRHLRRRECVVCAVCCASVRRYRRGGEQLLPGLTLACVVNQLIVFCKVHQGHGGSLGFRAWIHMQTSLMWTILGTNMVPVRVQMVYIRGYIM